MRKMGNEKRTAVHLLNVIVFFHVLSAEYIALTLHGKNKTRLLVAYEDKPYPESKQVTDILSFIFFAPFRCGNTESNERSDPLTIFIRLRKLMKHFKAWISKLKFFHTG